LRTVIVGGPKTGKTLLSQTMPEPTYHTDDYMHLGWSEASQKVSELFFASGPWTVEGVATARALRRWLLRNGEGKPCDRVLVLTKVRDTSAYKPGHLTMAKGIHTVFQQIKTDLERRGVLIEVQE